MKRIIPLGLLLLALTAAGCAPYQYQGTEYPDAAAAADFTLEKADGGSYQLSQHQGKVILVFFGYTSCPDVCPVTLSVAKQVLDGLGDEAEGVEFLFITVDPERDSAEVMAGHTAAFHPGITGLVGSPEALAAAREAWGIFAEKEPLPDSASGYAMNHTARQFLVDKAGRLRLSYAHATLAEPIIEDIQQLLKE